MLPISCFSRALVYIALKWNVFLLCEDVCVNVCKHVGVDLK